MTLNYQKTETWKSIITLLEIGITIATVGFGIFQGKALLSGDGEKKSEALKQQAQLETVFTNNELLIGAYRCAEKNYEQALQLKPDALEKSRLETKRKTLDQEEEELKKLSDAVNNFILETNTSSTETYNQLAEAYNQKTEHYDQELKLFNEEINQFNKRLADYEIYLQVHCREADQ